MRRKERNQVESTISGSEGRRHAQEQHFLDRPDLLALLRAVTESLPVERIRVTPAGVTVYVRLENER